MTKITKGSLFLLAGLMISCGPSVEITSDWAADNAESTANYEKVLTMGMMANAQLKQSFEDELKMQLEQAGVEAMTARSQFAQNPDIKKEQLIKQVEQTQSDAILTVNILSENTNTRYVPTTTSAYNPMMYDYYGGFYDYYGYYYPRVYDPGYYTITQVYYVEANLYDTESDKLVYSAQTKVYDPEEIEAFAESFAEEIVAELKDEDLIEATTEMVSR